MTNLVCFSYILGRSVSAAVVLMEEAWLASRTASSTVRVLSGEQWMVTTCWN